MRYRKSVSTAFASRYRTDAGGKGAIAYVEAGTIDARHAPDSGELVRRHVRIAYGCAEKVMGGDQFRQPYVDRGADRVGEDAGRAAALPESAVDG